MLRFAAALVLAALVGCAPAMTSGNGGGADRVGTRRTLCVLDLSAGLGALKVKVYGGPKFNPWPGQVECNDEVYVPAHISVTSIGGGLGGPLRARIVFKTTDSPCMAWILMGIRNRQGDGEQRLVPCSWLPR